MLDVPWMQDDSDDSDPSSHFKLLSPSNTGNSHEKLRLRKSRAAGRRACTHLPRSHSKVAFGLLDANFARHDFLPFCSLEFDAFRSAWSNKDSQYCGACGKQKRLFQSFCGWGSCGNPDNRYKHTHTCIKMVSFFLSFPGTSRATLHLVSEATPI